MTDRVDKPRARLETPVEGRFRFDFDAEAMARTSERIARFLYWVNQARASMTEAVASSASLARLRAGEQRLAQANKPVEQAVAVLRSQLGLPPPETR